MKEIIFGSIAILVVTAVIAGIDFQLRPFHLKFTNPYMAAGFILIIIGICFIYYQGYLNGKTPQP